MRNRLVVMLGALCASLAARSAHAQAGAITGRITDAATQAPLSGAQVQATGAGRAALGAVTGEDGQYRIANVEPGSYRLLVRLVGYAPRRDSVRVQPGETAEFSAGLAAQASALNTVVVTASRRAERAQEAPASVSVVGAREITDRVAANPADHLRATPGVDISQTGVTGANVVVRGFNAAFSSSLQLLTDYRIAAVPGLQVNRLGTLPSNDQDLERIEVVLGPAAALYGPNTANGVVHLISKSALDQTGTIASVAGGERDAFVGAFRSAHKLTDKLGVKISGQYFRAREWEFVDTVEARLRDTAQTRLTAFRTAQTAAGRTPQQIADSIRNNPDLFAFSRVGVRPDMASRYGVEGRVDWRPVGDLSTVFQIGRSSSNNVDLTGLGASAQDDFSVTYYQARATLGRAFGQFYMEQGDAGETYTIRTGTPVIDNSKLYVGQLQHGLGIGARQNFIYGVDLLHTVPESEGTVYGRNEEDDKITQVGAYLQSETNLLSRLKLVLAGRVDQHSVLDNVIFSPRAGLVFEPVENQAFRVTYNRAFQAPTAINLFLDRLSSVSGPYAVRGVAPGTEGFNFHMANGDVAIRSPFNPAATGGPNTRVAYNQAAVSRYALNYLLATQQITLAEYARLAGANPNFGILRRNPQTGEMGAFDPASVSDLPGIEEELSEVIEAGYKGIVGERLLLTADVWHLRRKNFISQLFAPAPLLMANGPDVGAFLVANGIAPARAATLAGNVARTPLGAVSAQEADIYTSGIPILISYKNYASVDLDGVDLSAQLLFGTAWRAAATASFVSDNFFTVAGEQPIALNAPKRKGSVSLGYDGAGRSGLSGEARVRYVGGFPVYSGVYSGTACALPEGQGLGSCVEAATLTDLSFNYRIPRLTGTSVQLSVTDLFDEGYQGFAGVPVVGRMGLLRLTQEF